MSDPLDALAPFGVRVVWVDDLGGEVLLVDGDRLALVDADLTRQQAADSILWAMA